MASLPMPEERLSFLLSGNKATMRREVLCLVAGDSNVHRLEAVSSPERCCMEFLPVSGARFVRDGKGFRVQLHKKLKDEFYSSLYLHLGSNDVLTSEEVFYENAVQLCDWIHDVSPHTTVVLCEVIPRVPGKGTSIEDCRKLQRWIGRANDLLWELSKREVYLRYLGYRGMRPDSRYFSRDGLHLSTEGADLCYGVLCKDSDVQVCGPLHQPPVSFCDDDWPPLGKSDVLEPEENTRKQYADILKELPAFSEDCALKQTSVRMAREKKLGNQRVIVVANRKRKRKWSSKRSKQSKKFVRKMRSRSLLHHIDYISIETRDDVAVELKASKIQGSFMTRTPCFGSREAGKPTLEIVPVNHSEMLMTQKKTKQIPWIECFACSVRCSREDFLLDHICRRHCCWPQDCVTENGESSQFSVNQQEKPSLVKGESTVQEEELSGDYAKQIYSKTYLKKEMPSCEGSYSIFSPSEWRNIFQLGFLGILCGFDGMCHVIEMLEEQITDTARLLILLSNDVEQNPGPTYRCYWKQCTATFDEAFRLRVHVAEHVHRQQKCEWNGCTDCPYTEFEQIVRHAVDHLYHHQEYFSSLEDWHQFLPEGKFGDKTNLQNCPRHLRSQLKLMLFDEDFVMTSNPYTVADHKAYINRISILNPSQFKDMASGFVHKRNSLGETWSMETSNENLDVKTSSSNVPKPYYNVECEKKFDFVETKRPELGSKFFCGTTLKSSGNKRKYAETCNLSIEASWLNNLIQNLSSCHQAIALQNCILQTMLEQSLLTAKKQSFLRIEQELAKLASVDKCSNGSFACTVFRCNVLEKEIFYIRYVETGVYNGFMAQKYLPLLKEQLSTTDDSLLLHNVVTFEDIMQMCLDSNGDNVTRVRPERTFNASCRKNLPGEVKDLMEFPDSSEVKLESFVVHCLPFKSKVTLDKPENVFTNLKNVPVDLKAALFDFRMNQRDEKNVKVCSRDILNEPNSNPKNLLQQSEMLNCLSGDVKGKPGLFQKTARFQSHFLHTGHSVTATSLRNVCIRLYLQKKFKTLGSFFQQYFPDLNVSNDLNVDLQVPVETSDPIKKRRVQPVKKLVVTKNDLEQQLPSSLIGSTQEVTTNVYENFCCFLIEHGKFSVQQFDESGLFVCCMNDYSDVDGSFQENDFVYTIREKQETGDYFYCSCSIYRTLINIKEYNNSINEEFLILDSEGENCVTCMHCTFLKKMIVPELEAGNMHETKLQQFLGKAMEDIGKDVVELGKRNDTCKYSVLVEGYDRPTFVHLTFNKRLKKHIVSCMNGRCRSLRGHKKCVNTLMSSDVCKHLDLFKLHSEYWQKLIETTQNKDDTDLTAETEGVIDDMESSNDNVEYLNPISDLQVDNFNEQTGLWEFPCRSKHSPNKKDSSLLRQNVIKRDTWNDSNFPRLFDGCLKGPNLFPDIPADTCSCGAGWVRHPDDEDYCADGRYIHERKRTLVVYTSTAPVKCNIYTRVCCNCTDPCKLLWDEGSLESLHVLSRETAAGDEIGWEFVSMVMNSGYTFSAFCQLKSSVYKFRDERAKFMEPSVFLKWWFSWASNMKIDFREPCDVCGFEPRRLCCDGTKVGVGFRHATFEEISKADSNGVLHPTLHRRMDRCFLKSVDGVTKQQMIRNHETLNYVAKRELGDLPDKDILTDEELHDRIHSLKEALPEEFVPSFDRFTVMLGPEKVAYAHLLKMLCTTASVTSLLPPAYCTNLQPVISNLSLDDARFNAIMQEMRSYAPELRDLICESILCNDNDLPDDIKLLVQYLINESLNLEVTVAENATPQADSYNPPKFGRAYYFNKFGLKLREIRTFTIDKDNNVKRNIDHDDEAMDFEKCQKLYSKIQTSAPGTSTLFLWFCADHGHCYGFHMTSAEGRKDPSASLYSYLEKPPESVFYDFACNLQEYCLNRESGYYKNVRFFHDIFHSYAHKCSCAFKSNRLQGFEAVNSEICEQFNSFIQCIKKSARQMSQSHFCFYLQFFLHEWNEKKRKLSQRKIQIALAGLT